MPRCQHRTHTFKRRQVPVKVDTEAKASSTYQMSRKTDWISMRATSPIKKAITTGPCRWELTPPPPWVTPTKTDQWMPIEELTSCWQAKSQGCRRWWDRRGTRPTPNIISSRYTATRDYQITCPISTTNNHSLARWSSLLRDQWQARIIKGMPWQWGRDFRQRIRAEACTTKLIDRIRKCRRMGCRELIARRYLCWLGSKIHSNLS